MGRIAVEVDLETEPQEPSQYIAYDKQATKIGEALLGRVIEQDESLQNPYSAHLAASKAVETFPDEALHSNLPPIRSMGPEQMFKNAYQAFKARKQQAE
ncbi:MAG TPA: hypothetical protein VK983_03230 [Candidatus Limnocylindrales bacterium]|nr:hypothetical protein [Candidatus Limnocylindrales bacterium]